jgi:hypothetical protein
MEVYMILVSEIAQIIKYSYFLLSSYTNVTKIYKFLKYARPVLVFLQVLQLLFFLVQSLVAVSEGCDLSNIFIVQIVNVVVLAALHAQFFVKSYLDSRGIKY